VLCWYDLEIAACNVECVGLDSVFSYAQLWVSQQTIDQFTDVDTDELRQSPQLLRTKLQHTQTHTFNSPFSRTTQVSQYQKGKTNVDFTEARDSEWQWHQLGRMQVCTSLQTQTMPAPHHSVFYRQDAPPAAQPTASKH